MHHLKSNLSQTQWPSTQKNAIGFALSRAETRVFIMVVQRSTDTVVCSRVRQTNESII